MNQMKQVEIRMIPFVFCLKSIVYKSKELYNQLERIEELRPGTAKRLKDRDMVYGFESEKTKVDLMSVDES